MALTVDFHPEGGLKAMTKQFSEFTTFEIESQGNRVSIYADADALAELEKAAAILNAIFKRPVPTSYEARPTPDYADELVF